MSSSDIPTPLSVSDRCPVLSGGGSIELELRNPANRYEEIKCDLKIGKYFQSPGANYLIEESSRVDPVRIANCIIN